MKQMTDDKLIKTIKALKVKPDKAWQEVTLKKLQVISGSDVTASNNSRNQGRELFNFLFFFKMQAKYKLLVYAATTIVAVTVLGGVTVYAANNSAPGDFFFGLDKGIENVERSLITDPTKKLEYELARLQERLQELERSNETNEYQEQYNRVTELENEQESEDQQLQNDAQFQEMLAQLLQLKQQKENTADEQTKQELERLIEQLQNRLEIRKEQLEGSDDLDVSGTPEPSGVEDQNEDQNGDSNDDSPGDNNSGPDDSGNDDNGGSDDTDDSNDDQNDDQGENHGTPKPTKVEDDD